MGAVIQDIVVVTDWKQERIRDARRKAVELFDQQLVSLDMKSSINEYYTFMVAYCGSKNGWDEQEMDLKIRDEYCVWLREPPDKTMYWVRVQYGETYDGNPVIIDGSHNTKESDE